LPFKQEESSAHNDVASHRRPIQLVRHLRKHQPTN